MKVNQWRIEARTVLSAVHPELRDYVDLICEQGRERYESKRLNGYEARLYDIEPFAAEMETRLSLTLLRILLTTVNTPVLETLTHSVVRCVLLLEVLREHYAPGGKEKMESIQRYLRQLPSATDPKGTLTILRRWKLAR